MRTNAYIAARVAQGAYENYNSRTGPKGMVQLQQFLMNATSFIQQYVDHDSKQDSDVASF